MCLIILIMTTLYDYRVKIDLIDQMIVELLSERMDIVSKIGDYKKEKKLPPQDSKRWNRLINNIRSQALEMNLSPDLVEDIWDLIHKESLRIEEGS
ncbi:hypothetical protein GF362_06440 [Candidatus Dojkabacteria bacterium]|nr:hypothetical protein [Candidatus Dojkabacteria bacterium]